MTEYAHVGRHADILSSGRHIGPGDRITDDLLSEEDEHLIEEGRLVNISSFDGAYSNADHIEREETLPPIRPLTGLSAAAKPEEED